MFTWCDNTGLYVSDNYLICQKDTAVYFTPAIFKNNSSRKAENAVGACAYWLDLDMENAQEKLDDFLSASGFPQPTHIVSSGKGLHVYWVLTRMIPKETWQRKAKLLKEACRAFNFDADPARTADISSLLRVPGTLNHKYDPPRLVTLLKESDPIEDFIQDDLELTLRNSLESLDPDCDEETWTLKRIAPLARLGYRDLAMEWSSKGKKWLTKGNNGKTGQEYFPIVWNRFASEIAPPAKHTTYRTITHDAIYENFGLIKMGTEFFIIDRITYEIYKLRAGKIAIKRYNPNFDYSDFMNKATMFRGFEFNPKATTEGYINLWKRPTLEPRKADWSGIGDYLLNILCNGNDELYQYLLRYLAHMLQVPGEKPGVMLILLGGQGTGKGTFSKLLNRIWGDTFKQVNDVSLITGEFNATLEDCYICFLDEALFVGNHRGTEKLKSLITEPTLIINKKHEPERTISSCHRFIAASNAEHFKKTSQDDRRDVLFRLSEAKKGNLDYWKQLHAEVEGLPLQGLMYDLLHLDLSGFNVRQRPCTEELIEQKLKSLDAIGLFWYSYLNGQDEWVNFIATKDIVEKISNFRSYQKITDSEAVSRIKKYCPSALKRQRKTRYDRARGLVLPPIEIARKEFEEFIGGPIKWDVYEQEEMTQV